MERRFDAMARGSQRSGDDRAGREVAPPRRGGGLRLPGLKHWRRRRGFTQRELARRADLAEGYLWKVESGRRGCNPSVAHVLAELLEVDLQDLRTKYDAHEVQAASTGGAQAASGPARSRVAYRHVHQAYLRIFLEREVGSSYAAMDEGVLEKHCEERAWEEVLEAVRARKREIEFLGEVLEDGEVLQDRDLPEEVRSFLEAVLESYPDLDIRLLAVARRRVLSEEGHEALTKAMGDLL
jgi:transcriptional regulator with XRE-family HTH domain